MAYPQPALATPAAPDGDPTAVFGRRVVAALIDAALILVPTFLLLTATFEYLDVDRLDRDPQQFCDDYMEEHDGFCANFDDVNDRVYFSDGPDAATVAYFWAGSFVLLVVLQGLTGWTVGKLITGIRTVREDGRAPGIGKAFVRWLLWIVDGQPCGIPLVGFITALTTKGHRRVGDMVASTFVVRSSAAGAPITVPGLTAPAGGPAPMAYGAPTTAVGGPAPSAAGPQWDPQRGTYIQWDPAQQRWLQWDDATRTWTPIPGQ